MTPSPWLVAAGQREEGSPDAFYAALTARGKAARCHRTFIANSMSYRAENCTYHH
jgi:hypothetical protein